VARGARRAAAAAPDSGDGHADPPFAGLVRDALAHLYDPVALRRHPLAVAGGRGAGPSPPGRAGPGAVSALQRELLAAVEALRPAHPAGAGAAAGGRGAGRRHRLLALRYVEALPVAEVQARLAISRAEYFRAHQRAVAAVAEVLWERWGVAPPSDGRTGGAAPPPAAGHASAPLPSQPTSFVGRERELAEARRLLLAGRLLTLTGPGGTGKTRLALRLAEEVAGRFADGVAFVPLAALADPELVLPAVAHALGVPETGRRPLLEGLLAALRPRRLLLVLDTFERLTGAAPLVSDLLAACPGLTVLATSRMPLQAPGEQVFPVPPLALPAAGAEADRDALAGAEAVRLFVERARAVRPGFALTRETAPAVAEVCRRLDGLPLALELAAARVRALGVADLAARLGDRFRLLTGGSRTAPPHQQTLRATADWSHALLSAAGRAAFRRLAVFAGGFTLEAAEAVCVDADAGLAPGAPAGPEGGSGGGGGALGRPGPPAPAVRRDGVLDLLTGLVDQSLVEAEERGGGLRYRLLDTLREYAGERLAESGEGAAVRDRHLAWCIDLAERAVQGCHGPQQPAWLDRLEAEADNLRAALAWSLEGGRAAAGLRLAGALSGDCFWSLRGSRPEGRRWLEALLAAGPADAAAGGGLWRARALLGAGELAVFLGDPTWASTRFEQSVALYRDLDDRAGLADALGHIASCGRAGPAGRLRSWAAEGLALARALGDDALLARALLGAGNVARDSGELPAAAAYLEESLAVYRSVGQPWGIAAAQGSLANVALEHGDLLGAEALYAGRRALSRELRDPGATGGALLGLATVARRRGAHARARALYQEALALYLKVGQPAAAAACLEGVAWARAAQGHDEPAARLLSAADPALSAIGTSVPPTDRMTLEREVAAVRSRLGEAAFAAAWAAGQAMTLEQAVADALEDEAAPAPA
jgi:predicted ATPase